MKFKLICESPFDSVNVTINGHSQQVPAGISVASAVLLTNPLYTRKSPVSESPRAPLCLMGVCYECLMEIDEKKQQRACSVVVAEGMQINTAEIN